MFPNKPFQDYQDAFEKRNRFNSAYGKGYDAAGRSVFGTGSHNMYAGPGEVAAMRGQDSANEAELAETSNRLNQANLLQQQQDYYTFMHNQAVSGENQMLRQYDLSRRQIDAQRQKTNAIASLGNGWLRSSLLG
jgi:hypothetical protein